jgi:ribosomal protein L35AE/L33A
LNAAPYEDNVRDALVGTTGRWFAYTENADGTYALTLIPQTHGRVGNMTVSATGQLPSVNLGGAGAINAVGTSEFLINGETVNIASMRLRGNTPGNVLSYTTTENTQGVAFANLALFGTHTVAGVEEISTLLGRLITVNVGRAAAGGDEYTLMNIRTGESIVWINRNNDAGLGTATNLTDLYIIQTDSQGRITLGGDVANDQMELGHVVSAGGGMALVQLFDANAPNYMITAQTEIVDRMSNWAVRAGLVETQAGWTSAQIEEQAALGTLRLSELGAYSTELTMMFIRGGESDAALTR